jgi:hypothetical protein
VKSAHIKSLIRRDDIILRLGGSGDNWHMTWGEDDRQYVGVCDGFGWPKLTGYDMVGQEFNSRIYAISGQPPEVKFEFLPGYPELLNRVNAAGTQDINRYYGFGTIAVGSRIHQFLSTPNHPSLDPKGAPWPGQGFCGVKLIYSPDNGRTWRNQDGSTPVTWEPWAERSRENMVFFEESQHAFSILSVLQNGRGYAANRDGYVYVYAPNGDVEGTMNQLVMLRAPKARLLERKTYEYFAGLGSNREARWTPYIDERAVVHTFPRGWVNKATHPWAWVPSLAHNAPLGIYMMTSWGTASDATGKWFAKPSYLGFWTAPNPWGPWTQIHEDTAWTPAADHSSRAFAPQIAPKWIAPDGKSFWLVWSDFQKTAEPPELSHLTAETKRRWLPHYAFNMQRVDFV